MKAEPESRLENGTDVTFSIHDLAAKTEPEPWDGNAVLEILPHTFFTKYRQVFVHMSVFFLKSLLGK